MKKTWVILRRVSQALFLLIFIYILWSTTYPLKGFFPTGSFFKFDPLAIILTSISERVILPGISFCFLILFLTLIFGRFFCGWACPLGTAIDIVGFLRKKAMELNDLANKILRQFKFYILGFIFLFSLLGVQIAWAFDPVVIMARFVSLNFIPAITFLLNKFFIILVKDFHFYGLVYELYHKLKSSILGINIYYFSHSGIIFVLFLAICGLSLFIKRFWCRAICPLGALYSLIARFSFLRRTVEKCKNCYICRDRCRMGAIKEGLDYIKGECVLCMDCLYNCPQNVTRFRWK